MRSNVFRPALVALLALSGAAMAQDAGNAAPQPAAAPAVTATGAAPAAAPAAATPETVTATANGLIAPPPAGKGQVVFFREKKFKGAAIHFKVREGDAELGKLGSGDYFVVPVDPGSHTYAVQTEAKDNLTLQVEAGQTYFVQASISMGFMAGHPNLSASDEASFVALADRLERKQ
jgi:hypothetical protein